jgi:predicted dehydrogenase
MSQASQLSRRELLKRGSAAAAAAGLLGTRVWAAPAKLGANEQIRVAIIGPGRQGSGDLQQAANHGARVVAVADVNLPRAQACADKYKARAFQDYRKLLELKDVDAVIVATPDHWRVLCCVHAAQAGKDMYAEKCLTLTIHEGRVLANAVKKYKPVFQTGSQQRSMPANRLGCELVRNGRIGKVHTVLGANYPTSWECRIAGQPIPNGLDWDRWCGPVEPIAFHNDIYTPRAQPGWMSFRPFSGGEMTNWGSHGLDQIQWALGMDESGPVEIWVEGEKFDPPTFTEPGPAAPGEKRCNHPIIHYRYANGTVVKLSGGPMGGGIFIGDKGKITIDRAKLVSDPPEIAKEAIKDSDIHLYKSDDHMGNWLECIKTRKLCVAGVEAGHRSASVAHLGNIARRLGRKLQWDPKKERFVGDKEADTYLDRPRRKGYELPDRV